MKELNSFELERIIAEAYKEFHEKNKELYQKDIMEYWRLATDYKDKRVREYEKK